MVIDSGVAHEHRCCGPREAASERGTGCIAWRCMAWRQSARIEGFGFCGLAGTPKDEQVETMIAAHAAVMK